MKNRGTLNLVIDAVMFLVLALIAGLGFLMKYTLPPGREKILKYGENFQLYFLGLDRHQWGSIHLIAAYILLGLLALHLALHWKTIVALVRNAISPVPLRRTVTTVVVLLCAVLFTFPFFVISTRSEGGEYLSRHARGRGFDRPTEVNRAEGKPERMGVGAAEGRERVDAEEPGHAPEEPHGLGAVGRGHATIRGSMTIADVAKIYGISVGEVNRRVGLPFQTGEQETLGRLRRVYGLTMQQVRERLNASR
jgi:hypothetical protein